MKAPIATIISPTIKALTFKMLSSADSSALLWLTSSAAMTVPHNPDLFQTLPAEKKHYFEMSPEFAALDRQLEDLRTDPPSEGQERRRRNLHAERHKLKRTELRKAQPFKHPSTIAEEI